MSSNTALPIFTIIAARPYKVKSFRRKNKKIFTTNPCGVAKTTSFKVFVFKCLWIRLNFAPKDQVAGYSSKQLFVEQRTHRSFLCTCYETQLRAPAGLIEGLRATSLLLRYATNPSSYHIAGFKLSTEPISLISKRRRLPSANDSCCQFSRAVSLDVFFVFRARGLFGELKKCRKFRRRSVQPGKLLARGLSDDK